jgi:hypothetical protein
VRVVEACLLAARLGKAPDEFCILRRRFVYLMVVRTVTRSLKVDRDEGGEGGEGGERREYQHSLHEK